MLSQLFGGSSSSSTRKSSAGNVAPGLGRSSSIGSRTQSLGGDSESTSTSSQSQATRQSTASSHELEMSSERQHRRRHDQQLTAGPGESARLQEDPRRAQAARHPAAPVLVEATIVEITLGGSLKYGVQWELFGPASESKNFASLDGVIDSTSQGIGTMFPGFNWAMVSNPNTIKATLSALAGDNLLKVLSSPSVMVMDNQTAKIQVGRGAHRHLPKQDGTSTTDRTYTTISYKDTGVILTVKPRVTPGGLVQMEIEQEVSTVLEENASSLNSPSFKKRHHQLGGPCAPIKPWCWAV